MNVSVPDTSTAKLDYIKLAILLGDEHVLEQFGRSANTYAASALGKIRELIKNNPDNIDKVLNTMRGHMEALATKVIHTGETSKYTSINTKGNYVEFRSPGGDWLDSNWDKVIPTLMRTVVALDAAMDPKKYRQEYQKKLYKLLDSSKEKLASPNVNKLLSMYFSDDEKSSRNIARQLAKELLTKRQAERQAGNDGRDYWWRVTMPLGSAVDVVAKNEQEAKEKAAKHWGFDRTNHNTTDRARVEVIKPADTGAEKWGLWITGLNKFASRGGDRLEFDSRQAASEWYQDEAMTRPGIRQDVEIREIPTEGSSKESKPTGNPTAGNTAQGNLKWYIKNMETGEILHRFYARDYHEAVTELSWWKEQNPGLDLKYGRDDDEPAPSSNTGSFSGEWKIVDADGREIHRFGGVGNVQADANRTALAWLRQNPEHMRDGVEVVPIMDR
jgi:hypothetical protein